MNKIYKSLLFIAKLTIVVIAGLANASDVQYSAKEVTQEIQFDSFTFIIISE